MTMKDALHSRLDGWAGLTALVASRIHPMLLPQKATLPAVTYEQISADRIRAMGADTGVVRRRYQVSSWSKSYDTARAVAEQVRAALQRWNGTEASVVILASFIENDLDIYDDDAKIHQIPMDFEIVHEE